MASETADKEAPPAAASTAADEVVGASENSSQNTDESVKNSQGSEAKQEEEEADQQLDVDMKEAEGATKEIEAGVSTAKKGEDVEMTEDKDEAEEKDAEASSAAEAKTEDDEPSTDAQKNADADGDVEIKASDKAALVSKDDSNGAEAATEAAEAVSPKKYSPTKTDKSDTLTEKGGVAEATRLKESSEQGKSSSTKREESVQAPEGSNGVAEPAEPATKKQKMDAAGEKTPDKAAEPTATEETEGAAPSVMISRDDMAKMEEDSGRLKFEVITNDGTDEHMIQLTTLKNIFAKQLPKMPKEYIVRLVFDKNHRSMLILKNGTHVIGGICYRPFEKNHFAEIAFCAINASDQVKGYGTRLMNHLKEYVKTKGITHFLTYADNYAIGYFKKQGFTKSVSMARPNWYGYIKDYDGGTLMECTIHTQINYLRITSMIHLQRKAIQQKIKERSRSHTVYPGLAKFAEGRLMDIYMVPGVKEAGWSQAVIRNNRIGTRDQGSLKSQLSQLLKAVSSHRSAWPFHEPVDTSVVVDYLDHIKEPVDLQLISKRIDSGTYLSKAAFKADLEKMCDNCTTYNTPDTNYYKAAMDLREFIQSRVQVRDHK